MFKKIFASAVLLTSISASAQNLPTIASYEIVDTLCYSGYEKHFLTVTIEDLDGDSTYLSGIGADLGYIDAQYMIVEEPPYVPGATLRTFKLKSISTYFAPIDQLSEDNLLFYINGNSTADGGNTFDGVGNIPLYGELTASLDLSGVTFCSTDNPVDITQYATPGPGEYYWGIDQTIITNGSFDIQSYMSEANDGVSYDYINTAGCVAYAFASPNIVMAPDLSVNTTDATCGSADGSASVTITGQYAPFDVYWTTGFSESLSAGASTVNNLSSGAYYVTVTDGNGCTSQIAAPVSDADLTVTEIITDQNCPGSGDGAIDITVAGGTPDYFLWSTGQTTEDLTGLAGGEYTVHIHTTGNCQAFKTYNVGNPAPLEIGVNQIQGEDCSTGQFNSLIDISTFGGSGSYTWDWDSGASTMEDFTNPGVGIHTCTVTDAVSGCSMTWSTNVMDYGAPYVWLNSVDQANCGQTNGAIDMAILQNINPIASISWSSGQTTEDLTDIGAGTYIVTATDVNGCYTSEKVTVGYNKPYQPSICLLTVDTSYTYNQVIWEKDPGFASTIDGFNVYRETQQQGVFEKVAERPYALESFFIDNAASPMDRSWRYYLTTYDACGNESFPSFIHKTIHIVANTSNGTDYNVSWDKYEGITYTDVDLFRFDNTNGWQLIGTYGTTQLSMTDTPPVTAGLDYIVSFNLASVCTSSKAQDYNSSRSNNSSAIFTGGETTTSIQDEEIGLITIYPNPTESDLNVYIENPELFEMIELRDANGRLVFNQQLNSSKHVFEMTDLATGVYFIRLVANEKTITRKVIKR
ncbi:T9SS type A sorting domain-containing protein [Paracrocinitomix mangrovi]|uniref:T9SS type A sorting domain-containing protein n=1 Tax=Paracrocinitomix mangrovi TaxID=2862509 RepID=UPI001C8E9DFB|nr:T9SS type A sorting domain-containing protein [Paracrocinitomix mangrovi]UKN02656.1 T9SS type A sorting domain-containing protein [Paracrocinitomix mangrovi]